MPFVWADDKRTDCVDLSHLFDQCHVYHLTHLPLPLHIPDDHESAKGKLVIQEDEL